MEGFYLTFSARNDAFLSVALLVLRFCTEHTAQLVALDCVHLSIQVCNSYNLVSKELICKLKRMTNLGLLLMESLKHP